VCRGLEWPEAVSGVLLSAATVTNRSGWMLLTVARRASSLKALHSDFANAENWRIESPRTKNHITTGVGSLSNPEAKRAHRPQAAAAIAHKRACFVSRAGIVTSAAPNAGVNRQALAYRPISGRSRRHHIELVTVDEALHMVRPVLPNEQRDSIFIDALPVILPGVRKVPVNIRVHHRVA